MTRRKEIDVSTYKGPDRRQEQSAISYKSIWFIIAVIVAVQSWTCLMILDFYGWKRETIANRFTSQDGIELMKIHSADMSSISKDLSTIREIVVTLPKETPPKWFLDDHERLKDKVDALEELIRRRKI